MCDYVIGRSILQFREPIQLPVYLYSRRGTHSLIGACAKMHHNIVYHCAKKPVTTVLTYPWKCTVLHCNHLGNTWKPLVLMT